MTKKDSSDPSIFGHSWDTISRAQQGDMSGMRKPIVADNTIPWSKHDQELFDKFGTIVNLKEAGFYGTADRAERLGMKSAEQQSSAPGFSP